MAEEATRQTTQADGSIANLMNPDNLNNLKTAAIVAGGASLAVVAFKVLVTGSILKVGYDFIKEEEDTSLPPALEKLLGLSDEPDEFLKIERLNDKLDAYDYSFKKATTSKTAALRNAKVQSLQRRFGIDFSSFELDTEALKKIEDAAKKYEKKDMKKQKQLAKELTKVRSKALKSSSGGFRIPLLNTNYFEAEKLQGDRFKLERDFLKALSDALPKANASALAEAFKPSFQYDDKMPAAGSLDAIAALQEATSHAQSTPKHVWVLEFFGDVQASQVQDLRKEVTAVIRSANVSRGDEVVLVLNTGGGTVMGYGLAGAQLERIKNAGLRLTVCVEQVAASGGYLMGCVADELVAAPFAVLGSVGVITEIPNAYERLKQEGIIFKTATAGKYKRTITPTKKITPEDEKKLKEDLEQVLKLFRNWVDRNRPHMDIDKIATGETWFGPDALDMKLVDRLATLDDVLLEHTDNGAEVFSVNAKDPPAKLASLGAKGLLASLGAKDLQQGLDFLEKPSWRGRALSFLSRALASETGYETRKPWLQSREMLPGLTEIGLDDFRRTALMKRPDQAAEPLLYYEAEEGIDGKTWDGF